MSSRRNLLSGIAGAVAAWFAPAVAIAAPGSRRIDAPPPGHCKWTVMVTPHRGKWEFAVFLEREPGAGVGAVGTMGRADTHAEAVASVANILENTYSATSLYAPAKNHTTKAST